MLESAHDCQFSGGDATISCESVSSTGVWVNHRDDVSYNQLQKFWSELPLHARQELMRIDKQTLFEQTRKNMYCSRCNGLLLEGYMQIVMYGKSLQQEGMFSQGSGNRLVTSKSRTDEKLCLTTGCKSCNTDVQDPSVHPWGGLITTRDGTLTLLDCYICSNNLKELQNVFDSARARERERELLYPDACGGGGRGWISQGMLGYGRGHGTRETCALHTSRLSVDTLVDFWSALGEETRYSLLRMKEEDFMERLINRFDRKKFCKDCRKNVIREFKELKELKRMRRDVRCTSWFCGADTSFQYEVTLDTIQADWHQNYADSAGTYTHYEWAVGTGEGKSDILDFENVGSNSRVQVNGLDLTGLNSCYITLRAWITDGRCNEISVKAHALKGQHCVHGRLLLADGFVTITRGEGIRRFFEHAEELEEEEDDDFMDKDGNELDAECSRPQKHANSPELARGFLLEAATVIFKEQVEKAFREGTARQNAHSMFVSLALKLLEERVLVACKDISTLEKQCKLLEEEEKEKRDEEERRERRRVKEKEKKLRRKERLKIKEKEKEKKCGQLSQTSIPDNKKELTFVNDEPEVDDNTNSEEQEDSISSMPASDDFTQEDPISDYDEFNYRKDGNQLFVTDQSKHNHRRLESWKDYQLDQPSKWSDKRRFENGSTVKKVVPWFHSDGFETPPRKGSSNGVNKPVRRSNGSRYNERLQGCHTKQVWEPKTSFNCAAVTDRSADIVRPVTSDKDNDLKESKSSVNVEPESECGTTDLSPSSSNSNSDSCSSSTSDSEFASQHSEVIKDTSLCLQSSGELLPKTSESVTRSHSQGNTDMIPPSLNGNSHYLQYGVGGLQPLGPPLLNHNDPPMWQPVPPVTSVKDHSKAIPIKTEQAENPEKPLKSFSNGSEKQNGYSDQSQKGNTGFSLFYFGGPVDISNGFKADTDVNFCLKTSAWGDSCGVEEYNLFAANNGINFPSFEFLRMLNL